MSARAAAIANENRQIEESQSRAIAAREAESRPRNALEAMASRLQVTPGALQETLKKTVFSECKNNEQFIALVMVANEYQLNPLLKEIYAFPGKGGQIVPMVSIDGWISLMNRHPQFDGIEFDYMVDEKGGIDAIEAIVHIKGRSHPVKVTEFLEENKRNTEPWKNMPRRMLRHRALIQAARIAFGFSGIASEDDGEIIDIVPQRATRLPDDRPMGEVIDDEIPAHDEKTGEVIDQAEAEPEPQRDSRGMTEVDEETARKLDAGEDAEEEPEGEDDEPSPTQKQLKLYRDRIASAKSVDDVKGIEADFVKERALFDDEDAGAIDQLIIGRKRELGKGEG